MEKKLAGGKTVTNPRLLKELYRIYYRENWRAVRIVLTVVSIPCLIAGLYFYTYGFGSIYTIAALWLGLILIIYPRNAYRRPYKQAKNEVSEVFFSFYENEMKEKTDGSAVMYPYSEIEEVLESPGYFYFFHTKRSVSVLDKRGINSGSADSIAALLKTKISKYKKIK